MEASNTNVRRNSNANSRVNTNLHAFNYRKLAVYILVSILCFILTILIIYGLTYAFTKCYKKKSFGSFLLDGNIVDVCANKFEPIITTKKERKAEDDKEVFHFSNQDYTYDQAKCKCNAYGAKLATYAQIVNAYNKGADWCSYGWSDGQTAYYPTQPCSFDRLQKGFTPQNPNLQCGNPGVNGGFWQSPSMKFGVNCYGVKPKGQIAQIKTKSCPETPFCKQDQNSNAASRRSTDVISGFNDKQWSSFDRV